MHDRETAAGTRLSARVDLTSTSRALYAMIEWEDMVGKSLSTPIHAAGCLHAKAYFTTNLVGGRQSCSQSAIQRLQVPNPKDMPGTAGEKCVVGKMSFYVCTGLTTTSNARLV